MKRKRQRWHCLDCGIDTIAAGHYYMVRDHVWAATGLGPHGGMLCLGCCERRLGRKLKYRDFTAVMPAAWGWRYGRPRFGKA